MIRSFRDLIIQVRLVSMLEQYNILKQEKEQERQRQRVKTFLVLTNNAGFFSLPNVFLFMMDIHLFIIGPEKASGTANNRAGSTFWVKTKSSEEWEEGF